MKSIPYREAPAPKEPASQDAQMGISDCASARSGSQHPVDSSSESTEAECRQEPASQDARRRITVPAELEQLSVVQEFIASELENYDCPMKAQFQIDLAVEEIFVNIVSYAYRPEVGEATICCEVEEDPLRVTIQFLDHGHPFDPLAKQDADTGEEALLETEGGLGILLVKKNMDDVQYSYEGGKNILTIRKKLCD